MSEYFFKRISNPNFVTSNSLMTAMCFGSPHFPHSQNQRLITLFLVALIFIPPVNKSTCRMSNLRTAHVVVSNLVV